MKTFFTVIVVALLAWYLYAAIKRGGLFIPSLSLGGVG